MSKTLEILFQSRARVKLMKFFLRNSNQEFRIGEIIKRVRERPDTVRREIRGLVKIGALLKK